MYHIEYLPCMKPATEFEIDVNRKKANHVIEMLQERQINGYYFDSVGEGIEKVAELIPEGTTVGLGGSTTIVQCGLIERLRELPVILYDRYREGVPKEQISEMRWQSLTADVFLASTNAVTMSGQLVNIDGIGNRVAAMMFGPKKVILFAGVNKIVNTVHDGIRQIHGKTGPINVQRFGAETPCREQGICDRDGCRAPKSICNKYTIIHGESDSNRMHVILVGENLGF